MLNMQNYKVKQKQATYSVIFLVVLPSIPDCLYMFPNQVLLRKVNFLLRKVRLGSLSYLTIARTPAFLVIPSPGLRFTDCFPSVPLPSASTRINHKLIKVKKMITFSYLHMNLHLFSDIFPDGICALTAKKVHCLNLSLRKNFPFSFKQSSQLTAFSSPYLQKPSQVKPHSSQKVLNQTGWAARAQPFLPIMGLV